jgi:hypothetical protein
MKVHVSQLGKSVSLTILALLSLTFARTVTAEVKILAAEPEIAYGEKGVYDLWLTGQNFSSIAQDNQIEIKDRHPSSVPACDAGKSQEGSGKTVSAPCLETLEIPQGGEGNRLHLRLLPGHEGTLYLRVRVGDTVSAPQKVVLAKISKAYLEVLSAFVLVAVAVALVWLLWRSIGPRSASGLMRNPLAAFLIDDQTNSYSLSRFQLMVWSTVIVFGYVHLYFSRQLVQGVPGLPPIPDGVPTLLGLSAGTTVLAVGATLARGSKGAGPVKPTAADLISVGGTVVPERVQFLVWTLLGAAGFLGIVLAAEPTTISALPEVPQSLLYLMGVSSAGYLAGKYIRSPGPVIRSVQANPVDLPPPELTDLVLRVQGENLGAKARFSIDDKPLADWQYTIAATMAQEASSAEFCKQLDLIVHKAQEYQLPRAGNQPHELNVINSDGQSAAAQFPSDMMKIITATIAVGAKSIDVQGDNFTQDTRVAWIIDQQEVAGITVQFQSRTRLLVTLPHYISSGTKGTLRLVSPANLKAEIVVAPK